MQNLSKVPMLDLERILNFMTTISGFATGENYIVIVAEDYVGNTAVDAQTVSGTLYNNFKVNVDKEQELASRFNVSGIPFFVLFKKSRNSFEVNF